MTRLPVPGSDADYWGNLLNDFLGVEHNGDGTHKNTVNLTGDQIVAGSKTFSTPPKVPTPSGADDVTTKAYVDSAVASQAVEVARGGTLVGTRKRINFIQGSNVTLSAADNSGSGQVDVTIGAAGGSSVYVNVADYGALGDGATDDTAAIQSAIDSSNDGDTIYFPAGTYIISAPIRLQARRLYEGSGTSSAVIKQGGGINMTSASGPVTGLFVADGWYNNFGSCDYPVILRNLSFDGNRSNNPSSTACGYIGYNFWSRMYNCYFTDMPADGVRLTDVTQDGTIATGGVGSAWLLSDNWIENTGGMGIYVQSNQNNHNMDGMLKNTMISYTGSHGVVIDYSAGWYVCDNHLWGIGGTAIAAGKTYATQIIGNYIEDFGGAKQSGEWYQGIYMRQGDGRQSVCARNIISCSEEVASPSNPNYEFINLVSDSGSTTAVILVQGNQLLSAGTTLAYGLTAYNQSGGVLRVTFSDNQLSNFASGRDTSIDAGVIARTDQNYSVIGGGAGPAAAMQSGAGASPPTPTFSTNTWDNSGVINLGTGTSTAAGNQVTVTFSGAWQGVPIVTISPLTSGAAAVQAYVTSVSATAFTIAYGTAPTASQAVGTYSFSFRLSGS